MTRASAGSSERQPAAPPGIEEASRLCAILECLPYPALIVDVRCRVRAANGLVRARLGAPGVVVGGRCFELLHGRQRRCDARSGPCPLRRAQAERCGHTVVHLHVGPRGRQREQVVVEPIGDGSGQTVACLTTLRRADPGLGQADGAESATPWLADPRSWEMPRPVTRHRARGRAGSRARKPPRGSR